MFYQASRGAYFCKKIFVFTFLLEGCIAGAFGRVSIMGKAICTSEQMKSFLLKRNPKVQQKYLDLASIYIEEGIREGVRGDLAWAQSLLETNYFRFGRDVHPQQNNFAGLGTVRKDVKGHFFKTAREGIRAQIQHLKAYASRKNLNQPCVDPRFKFVKMRACAPYIENLSGKWAFPGYDSKKYKSLTMAQRVQDSYGDKIVKLWEQIQKEDKTTPKTPRLSRLRMVQPRRLIQH